jgi:methylated-DNA-[protein]-cysteine S-methyltransferase
MKATFSYCCIDSPLGAMLLVAAGGALEGIYFDGQKYGPAIGGEWREDPRLPELRAGRAQLADYFAGTRKRFDLPLAPAGTAFQRAVWNAIAAVPWGATSTSGARAERAGHPGCARAAGAAPGRNPLSIVMPCQRIVGADGGLTGYAGGLARKRALLALERTATRRAA